MLSLKIEELQLLHQLLSVENQDPALLAQIVAALQLNQETELELSEADLDLLLDLLPPPTQAQPLPTQLRLKLTTFLQQLRGVTT